MPDDQQTSQSASRGGTTVWLVLAAALADGAVAAFWERADAVAYETALRASGSHDRAVVRAVVARGVRRLCGEPLWLDDIADPESWRHADDANDLGDHTAEV